MITVERPTFPQLVIQLLIIRIKAGYLLKQITRFETKTFYWQLRFIQQLHR